ncbi:MAG: hypothetical protein GY864_03615 [Desulfobacterales bacterium]|nr:hypothetical protein [Desulfobacterales bacterium]
MSLFEAAGTIWEGLNRKQVNIETTSLSLNLLICKEKMGQELRFVADSMLGKLAKWLRVLGYDTHYQSHYRPEMIDNLVKGGRLLISRHRETCNRHENALLIHGNRVGDQLAELKDSTRLEPDSSAWFSRCLICNVLLEEAHIDEARKNMPEYIFFQNINIRFCPVCERYYWPGSHRERMAKLLREWGFLGQPAPQPLNKM